MNILPTKRPSLQVAGTFAMICNTILERSQHSGLSDTPILKLAAYLPLALVSIQTALGCLVRFSSRESGYRSATRTVHRFLGIVFPVAGWIQCLASAATLQGHCQGDNLRQCLAHYSIASTRVCLADWSLTLSEFYRELSALHTEYSS